MRGIRSQSKARPRTSRRRRILPGVSALALAAATLAAVGGATLAIPAAAHAAPAGTKPIDYSATLSTSGQSLWGAGLTSGPTSSSHTWFDQTWDKSGSVGGVTSLSFDPCFGIAGGCEIGLGDYGIELSGSTSGELGLSDTFNWDSGGSVDVSYPFQLHVSAPADDSFAPGDTVTISTQAPAVLGGATITNSYPSFHDVQVNGAFGIHASASGRLCVGGCVQGEIFSVDYPNSGSATGQIFDLSGNDMLLIQGLGLGKCFGLAEGFLLGFSTYPNPNDYCSNGQGSDNGYIAFPNPMIGTQASGDAGAATTVSGTKLAATGSSPYIVVPISAVAWAAKIADIPCCFPNWAPVFHGYGVSYTLLNEIFTTLLTEYQELTFAPTVDLTLDFGQAVDYTVTGPGSVVVESGHGQQVTFPLGDSVAVTAPTTLHVTPTVSMGDTTFSNHTYDALSEKGEVKALELTAEIPGYDFGYGISFPGLSLRLGPVYDTGSVDLSPDVDAYTVAKSTWQLGGFGSQQLDPFTLVPDPVPTGAGTTVHPVEGASFTGTVATFSDPDTTATGADYTARMDWCDGSAAGAGAVSGTGGALAVGATHTYAEEGTYAVTVTLQDADVATVHTTVTSHALVADAALHAAPVGNTTLAGTNAPALLWPGSWRGAVATFTDDDPQGTLADYTASIGWGDGTSSVGTVAAGTGGRFTVTGAHAYATGNLGPHAVTVTVADVGGSTTSTTTTVLAYQDAAAGAFAVSSAAVAGVAPAYTGTVTVWGAPWARQNPTSSGTATSGFMGWFGTAPASPAPGAGCTASVRLSGTVGDQVKPPVQVPAWLAVPVIGSVQRSGPAVSVQGPVHWVVVHVTSRYGPTPGQSGTGTVAAAIC